MTNNGSDRYTIQIEPSRDIPSPTARQIVQFMTRREAETAARAIGWSTMDATRVSVMGFYVWTIMESHQMAVTRDGYLAWSQERS